MITHDAQVELMKKWVMVLNKMNDFTAGADAKLDDGS